MERLIILKVEEQASLKEILCILGYFNIQRNEERKESGGVSAEGFVTHSKSIVIFS